MPEKIAMICFKKHSKNVVKFQYFSKVSTTHVTGHVVHMFSFVVFVYIANLFGSQVQVQT